MSEFVATNEQLITGVGMFLLVPVLIIVLGLFCGLLSVLMEQKFPRLVVGCLFWVAVYQSIFGASGIPYRCMWLVIAFAISKYLKFAEKKDKEEEKNKDESQDKDLVK